MPGWVLIVEDDAALTRTIVQFLASEGIRAVRTAANPTEAVTAARQPGLVAALVDVWLPGGNGIALAEELRALQPQSDIVIWSGEDDIATVRRAHAARFDFLTKGPGTELLRERARRWAQARTQVTAKTLTVDERFIEIRSRSVLTDPQANALRLALEQRSYREIATALGVTKKAVEALSSRIAQRTGRSLAEWTRRPPRPRQRGRRTAEQRPSSTGPQVCRVVGRGLKKATDVGRSPHMRGREDLPQGVPWVC